MSFKIQLSLYRYRCCSLMVFSLLLLAPRGKISYLQTVTGKEMPDSWAPPTQAPQSPFVSGRPASPCIASSDKGLTTSQPYLPLLKFLCLSRVILHFFHTCTIHTRIHRLIQKTDKIYILLCKTFFHVARGSFIMTFSLAAQ